MKRRFVRRLCHALVWVIVICLASIHVDASSRSPTALTVVKRTRKKRHKQISTGYAVAAGCVLAFNSGYINGCCLSGGMASDNSKQAVAAVTGAYTTSALGLATGNLAQFQSQLKILLCFISGSAIAGFLNPYPTPFYLSTTCGPAFLIGSLFLFAAGSIAYFDPSNRAYFQLAAVANGIQNSITSVHTSNLIRTTHYTGISSDIGTFFGQLLRGNEQNVKKLKIFVLLALSFWLGGYISYYATQEYASASLLFSAVLYELIGVSISFWIT